MSENKRFGIIHPEHLQVGAVTLVDMQPPTDKSRGDYISIEVIAGNLLKANFLVQRHTMQSDEDQVLGSMLMTDKSIFVFSGSYVDKDMRVSRSLTNWASQVSHRQPNSYLYPGLYLVMTDLNESYPPIARQLLNKAYPDKETDALRRHVIDGRGLQTPDGWSKFVELIQVK